MTAKAGDNCLVCGGQSLEPLITIPDIPTLCNRLCASETEARNAPRGDISLNYCLDCGHIVNSSFDESKVKYDGHFENTLTFSPHFRRYADATADRLINRYGLTGKRIVEIGCGNGEFLHLLCNPGNRGEGYDPSQPINGRAWRRPADKGRERADVANVVVARLFAEAAHINGILTKIRHWIPASRLSFGATRESPGANDSFRIKNSVTAEFLSKPTAEPREALSRRLHCAFLQLQNSSY